MKKTMFVAMLTKSPNEAEAAYIKKTGYNPTVLLVRPDFVPNEDHPLLVRSRHASWGLILATHLVKPSDILDAADLPEIVARGTAIEAERLRIDECVGIPTNRRGRPSSPSAKCPHCHGEIGDYDTLGFWYGWAFGIEPSYWQDLRLYVFRRDNYTCQECRMKFPPAFLQAHHIIPKEEGGEDGARNLQTLCTNCHKDTKPIYE